MARTHRDQRVYTYKHHPKVCVGYGMYSRRTECVCGGWLEYRMSNWPEPSWWNKEQRKKGRAFTRNLMQRARAGHIDWERVDEQPGEEWYW